MIRHCEVCGKEFKTKPSRVKKGWGRFCSNKCRGEWYVNNYSGENSPSWTGGDIECVCETCGSIFFRNKSEIEKYGGKYCCRECSDIGRKKKPLVYICENCNKSFVDERRRERQPRFCSRKCMGAWYSENIRGEDTSNWQGGPIDFECAWCGKIFQDNKARNRKFCSPECFAKWTSKYRRGENHHAWLGGLSFEPYGEEFNGELRKYIRKRDGYVCQICGCSQKRPVLSVHHIDYDKNNNVEFNLVSLCKPCHSTTNGNREYWERRLKGHISVIYYAEQLPLEMAA